MVIKSKNVKPYKTGSLLEVAQESRVGVRKDGQGLDKAFELLRGDHCGMLNKISAQ